MWNKRKNPRLHGYDYASAGYYAITLCTDRKQYHFGDVVDAVMQRSPIGELVHRELQRIPDRFENVALDAFVVMPNHVHAILALGGAGHSLGDIVCTVKNRITYFARKEHGGDRIWQRNFYDHVIRGDAALIKHRHYIEANPAQWADDEMNRINWNRFVSANPNFEWQRCCE